MVFLMKNLRRLEKTSGNMKAVMEAVSSIFNVLFMTGQLKKRTMAVLASIFFLGFSAGCSKHVQPEHISKASLPVFDHDPALVTGTLENGFSYVMKKNREPEDRVSMHLVVRAGSVHERDNQKGVAHYLEHMLFNGSENFPPGELIKYFQKIGMQFGNDANARTGFYETIYDVFLPDGKKESVSDGLKVMKDYACGALLLESEVQREKNVILAEKRDRDSASYRTFEAKLAFELPDMLLSQRLPIGTEEVIRSVDRSILKDFYDTWYRPENMVLVMVGDFDTDMGQSAVKSFFSDFKARTEAVSAPDSGKIDHNGTKVFYHYEKESGRTEFALEKLTWVPAVEDSLDEREKTIVEQIASAIVQNRLDRLVREPGCPVTSASISSGVLLRHVRYADFTVEADPENWSEAVAFLENNLRQALTYGFYQSELDRVKKNMISGLEQAVKTVETRDSSDLCLEYIRSIVTDRKILSPADSLALFRPIIENLDIETVNNAFRKAWAPDHLLIVVTGNAELGKEGTKPETSILKVYEKANTAEVKQPEDEAEAVFPYLEEPEKSGKITSRTEISDLGITVVQFENGVRLNLKKTDFDANKIMFKLIFGSGKSREPSDKPGLSSLATSLVNESGFGSMDRVTLRRALSGTLTQMGFMVNEDSFVLGGTTIPSEAALAFQLMRAQLLDPGFRKDSFDLIMKRMKQNYEEMERTVTGVDALYADRFLAGGDSRFGMPAFDVYSRNTSDDVEKWVRQSMEKDSLELSMTGDIDIEATINLAALYLGSLPGERKKPVYLEAGKDKLPKFPLNGRLELKVPTEIPKGQVTVAYSTDDYWNIYQTRRLSVLSAVFSEKLRDNIREQLGAAYSPYAYNQSSISFPGYGLFQAVVSLDPDKAETVEKKVREIAEDIRKNGISDDELRRAVDPVLTSIKDMRRTNSYWLNSVMSGSGRYAQKFEWARTIESDYASITAGDIKDVAEKFLGSDRSATVVIVPDLKEKKP